MKKSTPGLRNGRFSMNTLKWWKSVDGYPFEKAVAWPPVELMTWNFAHVTSMPNYKFHVLKVLKNSIPGPIYESKSLHWTWGLGTWTWAWQQQQWQKNDRTSDCFSIKRNTLGFLSTKSIIMILGMIRFKDRFWMTVRTQKSLRRKKSVNFISSCL